MMRNQKRVLIIGGIKQMIEIVEAAKRMGFYTIVADNEFGAAAKRHADKAVDLGPTEVAELAAMAAEEKIEGVFTAIDDINVWNALKLCKTAGLPMFASQEQMNMGSAKNKFLEFCRIFNVPVRLEPEAADLAIEGMPSIPFLPLSAEESAGHSHKVKMYYTIHNGNSWAHQRPRLFIKAPAGSRRRVAPLFSRGSNKAVSEPVYQ